MHCALRKACLVVGNDEILPAQLLSEEFLDGTTFAEWKEGYADTIGINLVEIRETEEPNVIFVKFGSVDLSGEVRVDRYFEGTWVVVPAEDGRWLLDEPDIVEVQEPGWDWFWVE